MVMAGIKGKNKIENTLGMFDLLKGIGMLLIVFAHNRSVFPELIFQKSTEIDKANVVRTLTFINGASIPAIIIFAFIVTFAAALMPAFFVVGGYGFRKRPIAKGFKLLSKEMLKPYFITVIVTTLCNVCLHYAFFRYLPGAVQESLKVFGGMALGVSETVTIGTITLFANGPVWYVLALFWSLALFNVVLNLAKEKQVPYYVLGISVVGWLLSYLPFTPWCISQGMVGVLYAYMGYWIKKNKLIGREFSVKEKVLIIVLVAIPNLVMCAFGLITEMADNVYSLGPITYIENGLLGIVYIYLFLKLNALRGAISGGIRVVGRYSLYVMCIHTVEMIAVPWYVISGYFKEQPLLGFFVIYFVRLIIIFIGVFLVVKTSKLIKTLSDKLVTRKTRHKQGETDND